MIWTYLGCIGGEGGVIITFLDQNGKEHNFASLCDKSKLTLNVGDRFEYMPDEKRWIPIKPKRYEP